MVQVVHMLHGYELPRAVEIVPGVFVGGEAAALQLVAPRGSGAGGPEPDEFKFFSGELCWCVCVKACEGNLEPASVTCDTRAEMLLIQQQSAHVHGGLTVAKM